MLSGAIAGVGKCIKNVYDIRFAKKLIAFLIPIKEVTPEQRAKAIRRWEQDSNYRGKVGDTILSRANQQSMFFTLKG